MKQIYDRHHVIHLNFPLSTYEQFSDGENNTTSPEYVQMEVDQNQNYIEGPQPGCSKQVSSTFEQTPEDDGKVCIHSASIPLSAHSYCKLLDSITSVQMFL
ncbi:uncharacterized protein LOC143191896 isoform X2 [Rhynchophorus ferrugineus]|uniref:uncharacterized protein LOC143191896 isoform X2 n=1 Tax=Rhynchophorus ferrugineus TaxID=354439 RepID=UPI003FCE02B5